MYTAVISNAAMVDVPFVVLAFPDGINFEEHLQGAIEALRIIQAAPDKPAQAFTPVEVAEQIQAGAPAVTYRVIIKARDLTWI